MLGDPACPHCWVYACLQAFRAANPEVDEAIVVAGLSQALAEVLAPSVHAGTLSHVDALVAIVDGFRKHLSRAVADLAAGTSRKH